jgi:predicted nucleic acid-binding Zn ribbon protein
MRKEKRLDCLFCGGPIKNPRAGKDYCSDKCRWRYNNNQKKKELRAFAEDMLLSLKRNGLISEEVTLK